MRWFEQLFGFPETGPAHTRSMFTLEGTTLTSRANGRSFDVGRFETPPLQSLRARAGSPTGPARVTHEAIGDVLELHADPGNADALFQVASQLNCLEFADPREVPEDGITGYADDPTQGPACALAAAAATVYRNDFVPIGEQLGQTRDRQLDNMADARALLGDPDAFVTVRNGYAFSEPDRLRGAAQALQRVGREAFIDAMRIGVQSGVQVTFAKRFVEPEAPARVNQAFCSALSCGYDRSPREAWAPLATAVLDAAYEATLLAARAGVREGTCSGKVWLTFLGGGAFGNDPQWIADAIARALRVAGDASLDIHIAHHRRVDETMRRRIDDQRA
ncbi:MAG: hypothetical protein ACE37F_27750 [Nannocystaceae bacterium]|nr:hypothetical protein [bacterium]